jgi:uncharacterized protein YegP (UPF0339 family)
LIDAAFAIERISRGPRNGKFTLRHLPSGQHTFSLLIGEDVVFHGDSYFSAASAVNGIASVKQNLSQRADKAIERFVTRAGHHSFKVVAANAQTVGTSRAYLSPAEMDQQLAEVCRLVSNAPIDVADK